MKGKLFLPVAVMVGFLAASLPVFAHHGRATYDETKLATIMGKVSAFQFSNQGRQRQYRNVDWGRHEPEHACP